MARYIKLTNLLCMSIIAVILFIGPNLACAASGAEIDHEVDAALKTLFAKSESARALAEKAGNMVKVLFVKTAILSDTTAVWPHHMVFRPVSRSLVMPCFL